MQMSFKKPEVVVQKVVSSTKGAETRKHAIVGADQITVPKTARFESLNPLTVPS